ncbi:hypothetical protein [Chitinasiproducens palmae]|uniref:5'-deoxynucleotidase YfbR n=1 Tax=Chitinasiproducens palmae TaxID=1770053 RepID=A0A1H2PS61_9BURK|nr:hypothetical protein [Chitinasiproducens palmae]SDV49782.1 5'-deoxynucleotidase YfbR [Chitinasiproducens palmae]
MSTILTAGGTPFNFFAPWAASIDLDTIAHALSNLCRFTGHTRAFYSVAQHSVLVSEIVPPEFAMQGLLHDAHEAYVGDMAQPLKAILPGYRALEDTVAEAVRAAFDLPLELDAVVKHADLVALATERRDLMPPSSMHWQILDGVQPRSERITPVSPADAYRAFLDRYAELLAAAVTSPAATLWGISIDGSFEVVAFPDQATAERGAASFNSDPLLQQRAAERAGRRIASRRSLTAQARPWSGDSASHASDLARGAWKSYLPKERRA